MNQFFVLIVTNCEFLEIGYVLLFQKYVCFIFFGLTSFQKNHTIAKLQWEDLKYFPNRTSAKSVMIKTVLCGDSLYIFYMEHYIYMGLIKRAFVVTYQKVWVFRKIEHFGLRSSELDMA